MAAVDLALRLTLLGLLLRPVGDAFLRPCVLGVAALGLLIPGMSGRALVWVPLAILTGLRVALDWPLSDNHAYLLFYWCLAVALALGLGRTDRHTFLAMNGRVLIGLAFAFATLWKLISPDYLDDTFFRVTLLTDPRLEGVTMLFGGLTPEAVESQRVALLAHVDGALPGTIPGVAQSPRFLRLARFATLWTVVVEAIVALVFLAPAAWRCAPYRHVMLLLFCATTYAVAPVEGFGWLLIAMGLAQCTPQQYWTRRAYVAVFLLILFYREVPWASLLAGGG